MMKFANNYKPRIARFFLRDLLFQAIRMYLLSHKFDRFNASNSMTKFIARYIIC